MDVTSPEYAAWLAARPPAVRALAAEYPPGSRVAFGGGVAYVCSYTEWGGGGVGLSVSLTDPAVDYDRAMESRHSVCPDCLKGRCRRCGEG